MREPGQRGRLRGSPLDDALWVTREGIMNMEIYVYAGILAPMVALIVCTFALGAIELAERRIELDKN